MSDIVVNTSYGRVRGTNLGPVSVWRSIPYAQPPLGRLRFRPPQPPEAWSGVRDAITFGPTAPQDTTHLHSLTRALNAEAAASDTGSEDCLYLNIWSPGIDERRRPVMVWLHGGAFIVGSGSQPDYDGTGFATEGDVIVVTLNYRLGMLGFLHLDELAGEAYTSAGNCGLLDQIAALRWVHENIAAFGGDPNNVTLFGESAGAMSIGALLAMPAARGLFQRAILESGAAHTIQDSATATATAREFLDLLGLTSYTISALAEIPLATLLAAQGTLLAKNPLGGIRPVIDGKDIPERPLAALAAGAARNVDLLIGTNRDEIRLFIAEPSESAESTLDPGLVQNILGDRAVEVFSTYALARPGAELYDIGLDMFTDYTFRLPAILLAETQVSQGANVWMYRFDWPSPNSRFLACHALELPFVWNIFDGSTFRALLGENPPRELARNMHAAWLAFARTGNPDTTELAHWPAYDTEQRTTMLFNTQCTVLNDPQGTERTVWKGLL